MADNDIATKAPENDAQEVVPAAEGQSLFPGDSVAQQGPTMGVCYPPAFHTPLFADRWIGALHYR